MMFDCPNEFDTVEVGEAAHLMAADPLPSSSATSWEL